MSFNNYNIENNVVAQFDLWISSSDTTINLKIWEGTQFPSIKWIIRFVQYNTPADVTSWVAKSENVLITWKTGDILTVTRWFDWDTPTSFLLDDYIYLTNHKAVIEDLQTEIARLETAKLNLWSLRTWLANIWKMFFINWANEETEISLAASWYSLKSNWTTSTPTFQINSAEINWLTSNNTTLEEADLIDYYDNSLWANRKRNAIATNTREWLQRIATDAEVLAWTLENVTINPKQWKDIFKIVFPWDTVTYYSNITALSTTNASYTTLKSFNVTRDWIYKVQLAGAEWSWSSWKARVLVNWITYMEFISTTTSTQTFLDEISVWSWDLIEFQALASSWSMFLQTCYVKWNI